MKIWIKLLIGSIIGVFLVFFLPSQGIEAEDIFSFLYTLIINIGRYALFPMVFFALALGTYELRVDRRLIRTYLRLFLFLLFSTGVLTLLGVFSVMLFSPGRIPIFIENEVSIDIPTFKESLLQVFPRNFFSVFFSEGNHLFPIFIAALLMGLNFSFDKVVIRPVAQVFDSLSRIFYKLGSLIVELMGLGCIALTAYLLMQIKNVPQFDLFSQLLTILLVDSLIVVLAIYPALIYFFGGKENPYKWLYASLGPLILAFLSGDNLFSVPFLIKHGKENMGVPRRLNSTAYPLFAMVGKAGTAMVTAVSFLVILTSYSSLGISFGQYMWVFLFSFLISFILAPFPATGVIVALSLLCGMYGKGVEEGFLIIKPIIPLLTSIAVTLDVVTSSFSAFLLARHEGIQKEIEISSFI